MFPHFLIRFGKKQSQVGTYMHNPLLYHIISRPYKLLENFLTLEIQLAFALSDLVAFRKMHPLLNLK